MANGRRTTDYDSAAYSLPSLSPAELQAELADLLTSLSDSSLPSHQMIAEELLALSAIFDVADDQPAVQLFHSIRSFSKSPVWRPGETLRFLLATATTSPASTAETPLHLLISLPPDYPDSSPPLIQLHDKYIGNFLVTDELWGEVARTFMHEVGGVEWNQGEVCVFEGVEWSRAVAGEWLEAKESELKKGEVIRAGVGVYRIENFDLREEEEQVTEEEYTESSWARKPVTETPKNVVCPTIVSSEPIVDRKSVFVGHAAKITSTEELHAVLSTLLSDKKIARAAHNISAYRFTTSDGLLHQDNDDDGESAAGSRMAHLLSLLNVSNVLVVVTRWYGGIHLGADRFKHINAAARDALELGGFLVPAEDAKSSNKKGKKR